MKNSKLVRFIAILAALAIGLCILALVLYVTAISVYETMVIYNFDSPIYPTTIILTLVIADTIRSMYHGYRHGVSGPIMPSGLVMGIYGLMSWPGLLTAFVGMENLMYIMLISTFLSVSGVMAGNYMETSEE